MASMNFFMSVLKGLKDLCALFLRLLWILPKKLHFLIIKHKEPLRAWASFISIGSILAVVVNSCQIKNLLIKPNLKINFHLNHGLNYRIENLEKIAAKNVEWYATIIDVPELVKRQDVVPQDIASNKPFNVYDESASRVFLGEHQYQSLLYFGFFTITCENCKNSVKWYVFNYYPHNPEKSWFVEIFKKEYISEIQRPISRESLNKYFESKYPIKNRQPINIL